ncbi:hypothetical protein FFI16_004290 [Pseudomonas sp. KBS0710]|uniref:DUF7673 family protein n=1 Tax=Pseudomonas sp. KBS0710 TaxID=1179667 RepID=UPI00110D2CFC|nr:hypothetical protein [Pseudomonas sp. KBS0710]TSD75668.1 hypothetical protein FFI16_004290 [Pseudomonas sp. KBS0710]
MNPVLDPQTQHALEQLLTTAQYDTEQGRVVASFLLSWWRAEEHGGFALTDVWILDQELAEACALLFSWIAVNHVAPGVLGFAVPFEALASAWRDRV